MKPFLIVLLCVHVSVNAQQINGTLSEINDQGDTVLFPGASLVWKGTIIGTITSEKGSFSLTRVHETNELVLSAAGYGKDTLLIDSLISEFHFYLNRSKLLDAVIVESKDRGSSFSMMTAIKSETLGERELIKAACCNLSESFETNPSVDVNFADAVTGTKQIQMLGLSGQYALITKDNMPYLRGLASIYGLSFIPGTWIQSIQLSKGAGTVVNGYESFTGQINTELQSPIENKKLVFNAYVNANARNEYNLNLTKELNDTWSTALLLHASVNPLKQDMNMDNFIDIPIGKQLNLHNRWYYQTKKGFEGQWSAAYLKDNRIGGEMNFSESSDKNTTNNYGIGINSERYEFNAKNGYLIKKRAASSMGLQLSYSNHKQDNFYGLRNYSGEQSTLYANYIIETYIGNTNHKLKGGFSFLNDEMQNTFEKIKYNKNESVPGIFSEYTYNYGEKFNLIAGIRTDKHNLYGLFVTPRLHMRLGWNENKTVLRISGGRALKAPNPFSENTHLMASSRIFELQPSNFLLPYGLNAEKAWNYGLNMIHNFRLGYKDASIVIDAYRTDFTQQLVVDLDDNTNKVLFYNLKGPSYSNSLQTEFKLDLSKRWNIRAAYRFVETKTKYSKTLLLKPFQSINRAIINTSFETRDEHWLIDFTAQWFGRKRIPQTSDNPLYYQMNSYSPDFYNINAQLTYVIKRKKGRFDIYCGLENALNFMQHHPIIAHEDPFGKYFDASMVWGPIYGRMMYGGIRLRID